jgi:hypothetical protein
VQCSETDASAWYGKKGHKICKKCYDLNIKSKKQGGAGASTPTVVGVSGKRAREEGASPTPTLDAFGADVHISEIFAIKDERYPSLPMQMPPSLSAISLPHLPSRAPMCLSVCASVAGNSM